MGWTAHDIDLYTVGGGIVYFDRWDSDGLPTGMRDLGNATGLNLAPNSETLPHIRKRTNVRVIDLEIVLSKGLICNFSIDEYDKHNLAMALYGDVTGNAFSMMTANQIEGELRFLGNPVHGPKYYIYLWRVLLRLTNQIDFLSDEWGILDFEARVLDDTANHPDTPFGRIQQIIGS